jgi:hypothetical protein
MKFVISIFLSYSFWTSFSQDFSNLIINITQEDLKFDSDYENNYFHHFDNYEDSLDIFYFINSTTNQNARNKFEQELIHSISKYEGLSVEDKKFQKNLENCFKDIHKTFLSQYVEGADFNDLVNTGQYNCLSATALYAMALQELEIPFNIRKGNYHIYISAAPQTHNIILESTLPQEGVIYFSKNFRQNYIKELEKNKIISKEDYELTNEEKFEKYSNNDDIISPRELAAYQYYNIGIQSLEDLDYSNASKFFEKASYLHDDKIFSLLLLTSLTKQLPIGGAEKLSEDSEAFVKLLNYSPELYAGNFLGSITDFMQAKISANDESSIDDFYNKLKNEIRSSVLVDILTNEYHLYKSYFLMHQSKFDQAYEKLILCYHYDSTRIGLSDIFADIVNYELKACEDFIALNESLLTKIEQYPTLAKSEHTKKVFLLSCLIASSDYFSINKPIEGTKYLNSFREKAEFWDIVKLKDFGIGDGFGEASSYYVRIENYKKARDLLNEGLEYDFFNSTLNRKLEVMNNSGY